jgi:hypothetical protein
MRDGERSYRSLVLALMESRIRDSAVFPIMSFQAQADILAAIRWLAELDDEQCPFVTNEELERNGAWLRDIRAASNKESAR